MNKYHKYKPSNIDFLGDIPVEWDIKRVKDVLSLITISSISDVKIGLENIESGTGKFIKTNSEFDGNGVAFSKNDIIYGKLRPYLQKVWIAEFEGNAVGDFFVFRTKPNSNCNFVKWWMLSDGFTKKSDGSTFGAKMPRVSSDFIMNLNFPLPPLSVQSSIAAYLDSKTDNIDRRIALLRSKIEHYKQLRRSLISDVVTRGINKNVNLKKSGVDWLGDIPEHWEVKRVKDVMKLINGRAYSQEELLSDGKYKILRVGNFFTNESWYYSDLELEKDKYCHKNDLLYAWSASIGPFIWNEDNTIFHYHIWKVDFGNKYILKYVYLLLLAITRRKLYDMHGSAMVHLTMGDMNNTFIPLPPLSEQTAIAAYLDEKTSKIDAIVEKCETQIEQLAALRRSLIAQAVTGQIKVC